MVGAHLDSVPDGPGINDNGSGSAVILEIALQLARIGNMWSPRQQLRFVWFGAEEVGLLGSRHYVRELEASVDPDNGNRTGLDAVFANLNFDMLGSPNFARFIYDGSGCTGDATRSCEAVQRMFEE